MIKNIYENSKNLNLVRKNLNDFEKAFTLFNSEVKLNKIKMDTKK